MVTRFRVQAKRFLVTYPQCTLTKEAVLAFYRRKGTVRQYVVCRELHEDGNPHIHVCVEYQRKQTFNGERALDIDGFHPNIQKVRNWNSAVQYVKKGDDYIEELDDALNPFVLVSDFSDQRSFMSACFDRKINYQYASSAWSMRDSMNTLTCSSGAEFIADPRLRLLRPIESGCTWLLGPSGIGKSSWATAYCELPSLWVTHIDDLKGFRCGYHKSIIFDDMSFRHLPRESQIALVDTHQSRSIHVRYGTATLPAGLQKIFTSNVEIFISDPAVSRRVNKIDLS